MRNYKSDGGIMKKIALLLITVFVAQAQLLLSAESDIPFKYLHQMSPKIQRVCLNAEKDKGPIHIYAKCTDLDAQYEAFLKLATEIEKQEKYLNNVKEDK